MRPNLQSCAGGQSYAGTFERIHHGHVPACEAVTASLFWFSHRPIESYLPLIVLDRGADASVYGAICGFGAVMELSWLILLRPTLIRLLSGILPLYLGRQSSQLALHFITLAAWSGFPPYLTPEFGISPSRWG